tara:strand:+ start:1215 stop:1523 length:309 start_codon:yes stop_codon:yes gene_type:complete
MDEGFLDQLRCFPIEYSVPVAVLMDVSADTLPILNGWTQNVGGVVTQPENFFFEIEYFNEDGDVPVFLSITETDSDTYLDHILNKTNLNQSNEIITRIQINN